MAEATRLAYGYCFRPLDEAVIAQDQSLLKAYLEHAQSYPTLKDVDKTAQVFSLATRYFGPCFFNWLEVNRTGPRAELSRHIRLWVSGDISDQTLFSAFNRDIARLTNGHAPALATHQRVQVSFPSRYKGDDNGNEGMLNLFTLLGPAGVAKLLLSLDGKV